MEQIKDIFVRFLDRILNGPLESKVGWAIVSTGLISITASNLPSSEGEVRFNLFVVSGEFHFVNSSDTIFLVVGIIATIIGLIILYRSVLSPSVSRLDAMVKLSELLKVTGAANNSAIQAQFQRAFKYSVEAPAIRKIMLSDNPELTAIDYKIVQSNLRLENDKFCLDVKPIGYDIDKKYLLRVYWGFSTILICSYAVLHFQFFEGSIGRYVPFFWGVFWISAFVLIVILRVLRKKTALQRLLALS